MMIDFNTSSLMLKKMEIQMTPFVMVRSFLSYFEQPGDF